MAVLFLIPARGGSKGIPGKNYKLLGSKPLIQYSIEVARKLTNDENICVRSGHHCAIPLHARLSVDSSTRASFYIYNDESDIDKLINGIKKVQKVFKV